MNRASDTDEFERTYRRLRRRIVSGDIPPGSPIIEAELGDRLDVSRTPIRSALIRLRSENFLEGERGSFRARPLTIRDARDLCHLLGATERRAVERAARGSPQERKGLVRRLRECTEGLRKASRSAPIDPREVIRTARAFHERLTGSHGSARLTEFERSRRPQLERYLRMYLNAVPSYGELASRGQERVADAIEDGDPDAAGAATTALWRDTADRLVRAMESAGQRGRWERASAPA